MNIHSVELTFRKLGNYPDHLAQEGYDILAQLKEHLGDGNSRVFHVLEGAEKVLPLSSFLVSCIRKDPGSVLDLVNSGLLQGPVSGDVLSREAVRALEGVMDEEVLLSRLRSFRNRHMFRIAWRDLAGLSNLEETLADLTSLADLCMNIAIDWHYQRLSERYGSPLYPDGRRQNLVVLAMGKLGARELNFSSDIDLIFAYPLLGETSGAGKPVSNEEFFTYLARKLIRTLSLNTAEGLVFRVDTRLRPFGDSGPLVLCTDAVEEYYENYGRQWERYAMIKARAAAGDIAAGKQLLKALKPFVYKKYLDYSTIESLRQMKAMIMAEHDREGIRDDIKLGPGGIRDVEFIVQTFQLLKGGRIPALQERYLLRVLAHIERFSLLDSNLCKRLREAYIFLRVVENRLQEYADQQVHTLPPDPDRRLRLAVATGFSSWDEFRSMLRVHMENVHSIFTGLFSEKKEPTARPSKTHPGPEMSAPLLEHSEQFKQILKKCLLIWDDPKAPSSIQVLSSFGIKSSASLITALKNSVRAKVLPGRTREILDELAPRLLASCTMTDEPEKALEGSIKIIEAVLRRSIYLVLLKEYPQALFHLVKLCSRSRWISDLLSRQPILLDELIDAENLFSPLSRDELDIQISAVTKSLASDDMELFMDELRRIKKGAMLKIAACDLDGVLQVEQVGKMLTDLSEVLLAKCLESSLEYMLEKEPEFKGHGIFPGNCGMAVIGYGKMGGKEMSYGSDLDLVFLYDTGTSAFRNGADAGRLAYFFSRMVQRLIFLLTTRTSQGVLYQIDTRLRPNGSQGVLVSSLAGFGEYQRNRAWLWEHQAIIRARFVAGDEKTGQGFERVRKDLLMTKRDKGTLAKEILAMRERIAKNVKRDHGSDFFDIKRDPGGIIDIEFLIQYLVLLNASEHEELTSATGCLELLEILSQLKLLPVDDRDMLSETYRLYMKTVNHLTLDLEKPRLPGHSFSQERRRVTALFDRFMGNA